MENECWTWVEDKGENKQVEGMVTEMDEGEGEEEEERDEEEELFVVMVCVLLWYQLRDINEAEEVYFAFSCCMLKIQSALQEINMTLYKIRVGV